MYLLRYITHNILFVWLTVCVSIEKTIFNESYKTKGTVGRMTAYAVFSYMDSLCHWYSIDWQLTACVAPN